VTKLDELFVPLERGFYRTQKKKIWKRLQLFLSLSLACARAKKRTIVVLAPALQTKVETIAPAYTRQFVQVYNLQALLNHRANACSCLNNRSSLKAYVSKKKCCNNFDQEWVGPHFGRF
jgi:hypothetical protein